LAGFVVLFSAVGGWMGVLCDGFLCVFVFVWGGGGGGAMVILGLICSSILHFFYRATQIAGIFHILRY